MLKKYILSLFLFGIIVIVGSFVSLSEGDNVLNVKQVYNSNLEKSKYVVKEMVEEEEYYSVRIYYPETKYKELNDEIFNFITNKLNDFKNDIGVINKEELSYKFNYDVTFNSYEYGDYISIVIDTTYYSGGAHPNEYIKSFNYDIKENKMITIEDLIIKNKDIIAILSENSYNILKQEERIKKYSNEKFLSGGTSKNQENFSNFAFSKDGLIIFFNKYQVGPYVAGSFEVKLPYDILNLEI